LLIKLFNVVFCDLNYSDFLERKGKRLNVIDLRLNDNERENDRKRLKSRRREKR